jgi:hypothetical protein
MVSGGQRRSSRFTTIGVLALVAIVTAATAAGATTDARVRAAAQGVDGNKVKVAMVAADLSLLTQQHLAPDIGNPVQTAKAVVGEINATGRAGKYRLVLTPHVIQGAQVINTDIGRARCLEATQDDKPFAVVITAAVSIVTTRCVAVQNKALTITMGTWPDKLYQQSKGRLFAVGSNSSISRDAAFAAWPRILQDAKALKKKDKVGIILVDDPDTQAPVDGSLKPALKKLGYKVAAEVAIPCPEGGSTSCTQHDVAIQKMKDAGVDFVFMLAPTLAGAAISKAAADLDYKPTWTTIGDNVTDTVAQFFAPSKDNWDGAWGVDTVFPDVSKESDQCNAIVKQRSGVSFPKGSDGYGFTGVTCLQLLTLADAIAKVQGPLTQAKVIKALEGLGTIPSAHGPALTLSATKHAGGDHVFLSRYDKSTEKFEPVDDAKPIEAR